MTPPDSGPEVSEAFGGGYDCRGCSGRYGAVSAWRDAEGELPGEASEERMLVTLGEGASVDDGLAGGLKNGSSFQEVSTVDGGSGGKGLEDWTGAAGRGDGLADGVLNNWVNPPSGWVKPPPADAESEVPGDENPLEREGGGEDGTGRGESSPAPGLAGAGGADPETKTRVNSPPPCSTGGCGGPFTTAVALCGTGGVSRAGLGAGDGVCRAPRELNIWVNSPGPAPGPEGCAGGAAGLNGGSLLTECSPPGVIGAPGLLVTGSEKNGSVAFFAPSRSGSKAFRNIAVAVSGSACSGGFCPEFESLFAM